MKPRKTTLAIALLAIIGLAAPLSAGQRHGGGSGGRGGAVSRPGGAVGRAVPRGGVPVRPGIVAPYRVYGYHPYYYPGFGLGFYYGYPYYGYGYYGYPYGYGYPGYGYYGYGGYGDDYGYPGGYAGVVSGGAFGHLRIKDAPRDAEVLVDGNYVGIVDDFDGAFQRLNLDVGPHRIEIRAPELETLAIDVNVQPGQTVTYRAQMRPAQP